MIDFEKLGIKRESEFRINKKNLEYIGQIWNTRKILFIVNENSLCIDDKLGIFKNCVSKKFIYVPAESSFEQYDIILSKIKQFSNDYIIYLECGETASVLAYELSKLNYQALDMGSFYYRLQNLTYKTI